MQKPVNTIFFWLIWVCYTVFFGYFPRQFGFLLVSGSNSNLFCFPFKPLGWVGKGFFFYFLFFRNGKIAKSVMVCMGMGGWKLVIVANC